MTDQLSNFTSLRNIEPGTWAIEGIGGTKLFAHGIGDIRVSRTVNGEKQSGEIKDVLYVPGLSVNLISIACVTENGYNVTFNNDTANVTKDGKIIMVGTRVGKTLYRLDISTDQLVAKGMAASSNTAPLDIWHERLAHANERIIKQKATYGKLQLTMKSDHTTRTIHGHLCPSLRDGSAFLVVGISR
jgi:hypothetical protein